jgi:DNA helicase II / ATP-dependent DNA helicase PcrA
MADSLIRRNHPPTNTARLRPRPGNPEGEVHVVRWASLDEETQGLAAFVKHLIDDKGFALGDILVLCPRRLIGYGIRDQIRNLDIPVHSFYHEEALEDEAAQTALCILILSVTQDDRASLRWWLGFGSPTWRAGAYAKLRALSEQTGMEPSALLQEMAAGTRPSTGMKELVARWQELQGQIAALAQLDVAGVIDALFPDDEDGTAALREAALCVADDGEDSAALLDRLRTTATQPEMPEDGAFVRVMSLHKSKGLTAKACVVSGCTHGLIPFYNKDETPEEKAATLKEQRRLFYVAITRCTEVLALSSVARISPKLAYKMGASVRQNGATIASQIMGELRPRCPVARLGSQWVDDGFPIV